MLLRDGKRQEACSNFIIYFSYLDKKVENLNIYVEEISEGNLCRSLKTLKRPWLTSSRWLIKWPYISLYKQTQSSNKLKSFRHVIHTNVIHTNVIYTNVSFLCRLEALYTVLSVSVMCLAMESSVCTQVMRILTALTEKSISLL